MTATRLGRVQLLIMQTLWNKRQATARDITDALNESEPIAHSTVQTLLRTLEDKGSIAHKSEGRTFVFYPLVAEDKYKRSATRDLLDRVFGGDVASLVAHLLKNEKISRKELREIRQLIDEQP
ncbi:MAG: BlaI/MecI/CopY family transcriptional regulator [Pirellulales bacterium]